MTTPGWRARKSEAVNQPAPAPGGTKSVGRIDAVDWLRGLAVVLMIETHLYGYWTSPAARATRLFQDTRWWGGFPFRMFLLLAGVAMGIKFEAQIARGVERSAMVRGGVKRGFEVLVLAYLFRLQEYLLSFFWDWHDLFRVDILNCLGASMMLAAVICAPRRGRPQYAVTLAVAAAVLAVGPILGPGDILPAWLPRHLAAYIAGHDKMAAFPLIPPMAWTLVGVAMGHWLVRQNRDPRRLTRAFVICGLVGFAMVGCGEAGARDRPLRHSLPVRRRAADGAGGVLLSPRFDRDDGVAGARGRAALAAAPVFGDARLRADVAARLLGSRRARLRPALQAASRTGCRMAARRSRSCC